MRTLIFDDTLAGHHLEYLNKIYQAAVTHKGSNYIFAVPTKQFEEKKHLREWPQADNIKWFFLNDDEIRNILSKSQIATCYRLSKLIKKCAMEVKADHILLISLATAVPILPLILPKSVTLSGIVYRIYLRRKISGIKQMVDKTRYTVLARSKNVSKVFILNDPRSAERLNELYNTDKFISLADPVPEVRLELLEDLREELNIPSDKTVFLHFGAMDIRKGTIDILKAIALLDNTDLDDKVFIFAGNIPENLQAEFDADLDVARKNGARIIVEKGFVEYERLFNLCHTSDCILMPYRMSDLSSGALGYASIFNIPVIGPGSGLIGELITDNHLGHTLNVVSAKTIATALLDFKKYKTSSDYSSYNSSSAFTSTLLSKLS